MPFRTIAALALAGFFIFASACTPGNSTDLAATTSEAQPSSSTDSLWFEGERRLSNIRQLTFGGNNAEAYWSPDGDQLVFQSDYEGINAQGCDQIFVMNADGSNIGESRYQLASTGDGRTTCGYFLPDGRVLYASTHEANSQCPAPVFAAAGRYVWPIYPTYDIYAANADGSGVTKLIGGEGYDAEATVSPDGKYVVFTSTRSGDLELWRYELATGEVLQLTDALGYDGGAFFSPDSKQIVWRASRPQGDEATVYRELLADDKVEPSALDIFVADIDGSNARQVTDLPGANWAPFFHPDGKRIVFTTNHHMVNTNPRVFDIFIVNLDGSRLEQVTHAEVFDGFPMFSPDGSQIAFSSNRNAPEEGSTNVFVADWVD
jgi:Tol biopolymer transport system component